MTLQQIIDSIPDYAKDQRVNLQNVLQQGELTEQQTWMTAAACALACRNEALSRVIVAEAASKLSGEALNAAKSAFSVMQMNNIFYRFKHFAGADYDHMPARLRMQAIRGHGGDPIDFELVCLAVSAINGCEACVKSHEKVVRDKGVTPDAVTASIRIAATLHAVAGILEAEA